MGEELPAPKYPQLNVLIEGMRSEQCGYTAEQVAGIVAPYAERIRQLEAVVRGGVDDLLRLHSACGFPEDDVIDADKMIERIRQLEREMAERKTVSVDTPEFHELLGKFRSCGIMSTEDMANEIIAYIDGRTAGAAEAWIDVKDELPQPGERVLVSRYAGKVANDAHPGYPDNAWIEVSLIPDRFAGFLCDLTSTGYVTHWKRVAAPTPLGMEEANG
jgi:hypothetical protein